MEIVARALMIVVAIAIVAWPFFNPAEESDAALPGSADPVVEGLVVQRDAAYAAIKDLEFDHEMGKLSDADYRSMRAKMESKAVALLQELDGHQLSARPRVGAGTDGDDVIEREIQRLRQTPRTPSRLTCPKCGTAHAAGDAFCYKCGASLRGARCPNCGTRASVGDKFCARCGARVKG